MFDETKENQEHITDGTQPAQEPVNPYLAKEPVITPVEETVQMGEQNVYQSQEQPVQQNVYQSQEQPTQQNNQQSWDQLMNSSSVSTDASKPKKKNGAVIAIVVMAVLAVILLVAVIAVIAFGSFGNKKKEVAEALAATFKESGDYMNDAWDSEQFEGMFEGKEITVIADMEMPDGIGVEMTMQQTEDATAFYADGSMAGSSIIEMEGYVDDKTIVFAVPNMLDYAFTIDRETMDEDIWNLVDIGLLDEETVELLIEANEGQQEAELSEETLDEIGKEMLVVWTEYFAKTEMEKGEEKELTYNGEDVDCEGYVLVTNYGDAADLMDELLNIVEENDELMAYLEALLSTEYDDVDMEEEIADLRDDIEDIRDDAEEKLAVEFYLYDGKVAQIYCDDNGSTIEWNIEGGSFPLENTNIVFEGEYEEFEIIREGEMRDDEYRAAYTFVDEYDDEYVLDVRYTKETGELEFEILEYGYSLIFFAGSIEKTADDEVTLNIDTIEVDEEEIMSGEIIMVDGCGELQIPDGEELDLLNLTEDEWYDLVDELAFALMEIYY